METFLITFAVLLLAVSGMSIGLIVRGKALSRSCGGVGPDGEGLADCLCEREGRPKACEDGERPSDLVTLEPMLIRNR